MTSPEIAFVPLASEHLELLHGWLQQPHVREFWDNGHRTRKQVQAHHVDSDRDVLAFVVNLIRFCCNYRECGNTTTCPFISAKPYFWYSLCSVELNPV